MSGLGILLGLLAIVSGSGCDRKTAPSSEAMGKAAADQASKANVPLLMVVVDDPELAVEIQRRWNAEDRNPLKVDSLTSTDLRSQNFTLPADVDLVVFPVSLEAELVDAGQLIEIPTGSSIDEDFQESGLLGHFRSQFLRLDGKIHSLPLGGPTLMWLTKAIADETAGQAPVEAVDATAAGLRWEDLEAPLVASGKKNLALPDTGNWLACCLIARTVSLVRSPDEPSVFFAPGSLVPAIDNPAWVESLERLCELAIPPDPAHPRSPADVLGMVARGEALAGIGWPHAAFVGSDAGSAQTLPVRARRLPGSARRYSLRRSEWVERNSLEQSSFELQGLDGRAIAVTTASLHAGPSLQLAFWMANDASSNVASRSLASGPFRKAHLDSPAPWVGAALDIPSLPEWTAAMEAAHNSRLPVRFPELRGKERYLARLDQAVREALSGSRPAAEALSAAAADWQKFTEEAGAEKQAEALKRRQQ